MASRKVLKVRALRTFHGGGIPLYSFFIPGGLVLRIAQISRVGRDGQAVLEGFQRKEIRSHVKSIVEYLEGERVLFPNAIILSMSAEVEFKLSRGRHHRGLMAGADSGILEIPVYSSGQPVAWIVDGQQRSIALSQSKGQEILVPIIGFVSSNVELLREQFILVNKAKPLSNRLINELLPTVATVSIPRDLAPRRIPSELCTLLNQDENSPFYGLISQISSMDKEGSIVRDTAVVNMIRRSISNPLGALAAYKTNLESSPDIAMMYQVLLTFWSSVKIVFDDAWAKNPTQSRLMHSAGIEAMGILMDRLMARSFGQPNQGELICKWLQSIAPYCHWTSGTWESIGIKWNDIQNTGKHIKILADALVHLDFKLNTTI